MDRDFCIVSDADLHINAHFIGKRNPGLKRDFTYIQALGILFAGGDHALGLAATKAARWDPAADHLINGACCSPPSYPALSITRTVRANGVVVDLRGVLRIVAGAVPITREELRAHGYGVTDDYCLVHLDLAFS